MFGNIVETIFFFLEGYHFISHAVVLFRVRLLPRKDLVRIRYYFLFDTITVFLVCFCITGRLKEMAVVQIFQHLYYFLTWDKSVLARKVISWSSLEWTRSPQSKKWEAFEVAGTTFDMLFHLLNAYILSHSLSSTQVMFCLALIQAAIYLVLHNPRLAWSNPMDTPQWVEKRLQPLQPVTASEPAGLQ